MILETIKDAIARARLQHSEVAEMLGISTSSMGAKLRGAQIMRVCEAELLCELLGVTIECRIGPWIGKPMDAL